MSDNQNSLSELHKTFNTSEKVIFQLIHDATGHIPISMNKLIKGYDNEVYDIQTKDNRSYIIRIPHFGESTMVEEQWVIDQYKPTGAPIPTVIKVGTFREGETVREYMIQEKLTGKPLIEMRKKLNKEQLDYIYKQAGTIMRQLHTIKVDGFYKRHLDGTWGFGNWVRYANSNVKDRTKETPYLVQAGFKSEEVAKMITYLELLRDRFPCDQPVLCHGDYLEEHILVDSSSNISGIIDFGGYRGDDPIYDIAMLYSHTPTLNINVFKEGYGDNSMFQNDFLMKLQLYILSSQMGHTAHHVRSGMKPEAEHTANKLRKTFEELQKILS